ncbi:ATP-binding protein [Clostridiaceae bacterium HSG29]|nr:ATP-binding protein [Clostridiaceae bacterium HSG29]
MKLNIENKILIPFVLLFFISLSVLLLISFRNDYNFIINNSFRYMDNKLNEFEISFNENDLLNEEEMINDIKNVKLTNFIIVKDGDVIFNNTSFDINLNEVNAEKENGKIKHFIGENYLLSFMEYDFFSWTVLILEDKNELLSFFYESYKYNILASIIFLTFSLQITIFISANITKPIKKLVGFCEVISDGQYSEKIDLKRNDEIGQLGIAFNQMVGKLDTSINELVNMKNYNEDILKYIDKGIITFNSDKSIISKNPFAIQTIIETKNYLNNRNSFMDIVNKSIELTYKEKKSNDNLFEFTKKVDGDIKYYDFYTSIMWGENRNINGYICSFNNVTERKKLESRIQRLDRLATAGTLASGVAHEIRNPLTGMRTSIQVLKRRLKENLTGNNEIMFERLIKEIDRINKLISDLLNYSKRVDSKLQKVKVFQSVSDTLALLDGELKRKNIKTLIDCEDSEITFLIDPSQFNQILLNLIKNSVDAIEHENGEISVKMNYIDNLKNGAELIINDNGSGISNELIKKVFDPFFTTKSSGTGLGLSVVHELVYQNGGEINIQSIVGKGTTVSLYFKTGGISNE